MSKITCSIWGRTFNIPVDFDVFEGEAILDAQNEAVARLSAKMPDALTSIDAIAKYCRKADKNLFPQDVDNIFRYVMPVSFYVKRKAQKRVIALLCNYRFDEENGIAIVFENEKLSKIGPQDIIL